MKIRYFFYSLRWVKALFSPFKPFKIKWYIGKTQIGVPYFLPRKWVKATPELAYEATKKHIEREESLNKLNPKSARKIKPFGEIYQEKIKYSHAVPLKIGFSYCGLGWKTKWDSIRHEWNPVISFVFFGYQIAITIYAEHNTHYWEAWICYEYMTDKKLSKQERIAVCRKECPQTWIEFPKDGNKETVDYYDLILKRKYLKTLHKAFLYDKN